MTVPEMREAIQQHLDGTYLLDHTTLEGMSDTLDTMHRFIDSLASETWAVESWHRIIVLSAQRIMRETT